MLSSVLMNCHERQGFGLRIISPISGAIIIFGGEIYVDDTDLIITQPEFTTEKQTQEGLHNAAWAWASGPNTTGDAINPEKSHWIYAGYKWTNGSWAYALQPDLTMEIPLSDGSSTTISQGEVSTAVKSLEVWSTVDGNKAKHISMNFMSRFISWTSKMTNGHLSARLGWIAYKFYIMARVTVQTGNTSHAFGDCAVHTAKGELQDPSISGYQL